MFPLSDATAPAEKRRDDFRTPKWNIAPHCLPFVNVRGANLPESILLLTSILYVELGGVFPDTKVNRGWI
jgi:hypothetical protein